MYERGEIKIGKRIFSAVFNVVAMKKVVERYGGVEELGKELEKDYVKAIDEYAWILALLIEQGIALKNFEDGTDEKAPTDLQLQILMKPHEFIKHRESIYKIINEGMVSETESFEDEEVDEVLEEVLASKNGMGAEDK